MTEAQARILVPLDEEARAEVLRLVEAEGGFSHVTAARLVELRDEALGLRIGTGDRLAWNDRTMRSVAASVEKLNELDLAFGDGEDLRAIEPQDAGRVRLLVSAALADVAAARRKTERIIERLEAAAAVLDERPDLPPPSGPASTWAEIDTRRHGDRHRQLSLRDVLDQLDNHTDA